MVASPVEYCSFPLVYAQWLALEIVTLDVVFDITILSLVSMKQ